MGLDMYLYRRRYVQNWEHLQPEEKTEVTLSVGGQEVALQNPAYLVEQVAYWRKANQIHKYFCDLDGGRDECQEIPVEKAQLADLVRLCEEVLEDPRYSAKKLPTQEGFFFGSTDYGPDYLDDLRATIRQLKPLLAEAEEPGIRSPDYYYQASW